MEYTWMLLQYFYILSVHYMPITVQKILILSSSFVQNSYLLNSMETTGYYWKLLVSSTCTCSMYSLLICSSYSSCKNLFNDISVLIACATLPLYEQTALISQHHLQRKQQQKSQVKVTYIKCLLNVQPLELWPSFLSTNHVILCSTYTTHMIGNCHTTKLMYKLNHICANIWNFSVI